MCIYTSIHPSVHPSMHPPALPLHPSVRASMCLPRRSERSPAVPKSKPLCHGDIANGRYQDLYFFSCLLVDLLVCLCALFLCFHFICLLVLFHWGPTQWLQPLHRTKKTGDIASSGEQYLCFLDACSLVCLLAGLLVCLFVSLFLCFHFICLLVLSLRPTQWLQPLHRTKQNRRHCKWQISGFVFLWSLAR